MFVQKKRKIINLNGKYNTIVEKLCRPQNVYNLKIDILDDIYIKNNIANNSLDNMNYVQLKFFMKIKSYSFLTNEM